MQATEPTCDLELIPDATDHEIGLAFLVRNPGDSPLELRYFVPFIGFDLTVTADDGPVQVIQPAYDTGVQPRTESIRGGGAARLETPIKLRFDPQVGPAGGDIPTIWSMRHAPTPITVRVTLRFQNLVIGPCERRFIPAG
jgi:hypothetical protein